jgi:coenzyme PQQ biosynthesis protein PqqD
MSIEPIAPSSRPKISSRARLQTDKITGKPVLLYPEGALFLNPTAHSVALLCNGTETMESIVSNLASRYQSSSAEIAVQVENFLKRLRAKNLLELG